MALAETHPDRFPHFYDDDMTKWKEKFKRHRSERQKFKKIMMET
jgi:hypothetical protein